MDNPIVGVRFIGPNESFIDKYFKTGAEWFVGTVHNFSLSLARKFFSYPCFERADVATDGKTFVVSAGRKLPEVAANINLHVMDTDKLVHLARYEFNRVINPEGKSADQVRAEVRTLSVMHSLDLAEDEALSNVVRQISSDELDVIMLSEAPADTLAVVDQLPVAENEPLPPVGTADDTQFGADVLADGVGEGELGTPPAAVVVPDPAPLIVAETRVEEKGVEDRDQQEQEPKTGSVEEPAKDPISTAPMPVAEMDKAKLAEYAIEKFAVRLDKRTNIDDMRARIATLEERAAS